MKLGSEWARVTARTNAAGASGVRWNTSNGRGFVREGRRGDIYAGRDGNIYRNTGEGWQKFDGGWQDVGRPEPRDLVQNREGLRELSPEARDRLQERGGEGLKGLAAAGAGGLAGAAVGNRLGQGASDRGIGSAAPASNNGRRAASNALPRESGRRGRCARPRAVGPMRRGRVSALRRAPFRPISAAMRLRGSSATSDRSRHVMPIVLLPLASREAGWDKAASRDMGAAARLTAGTAAASAEAISAEADFGGRGGGGFGRRGGGGGRR